MSALQVGFLKGRQRKDAEIARLRAALKRSMVALDDWLDLSAPEHIAEVQQQNREALKENNTVVLP